MTTKKTIATFIILFSLILSVQGFAADYEETMKANIQKISDVKTIADYNALAAQFERIANVEKSKWHPGYYAVLCYVNSVALVQMSNDEKQAQLDKAQSIIDNLKKEFKNESEILALQGFLYEMRITGMTKAMKYSPMTTEVLNEAEELNPENPRIYYLQGMNTFHTPKAFGGGKGKAKPLFEKAKSLFENQKISNPLDPDWGALHNNQMLEECNKAD